MYKTGRQIYLSRWEIAELKLLVGDRMEYYQGELSDTIDQIETYNDHYDYYLNSIYDGDQERFQESIQMSLRDKDNYESELRQLRALDKKLWYYATAEETAQRRAEANNG